MTNEFFPADMDTDFDGPAVEIASDRKAAAQAYIAKTTAPGYYQKCWKCSGSGQTRWGVCYGCQGKGGKTFKTSPESRERAANQRMVKKAYQETELVEAFKAANPEAWAWLERTAPRWDLAQSLIEGVRKYGSLTEKQMAIVTNGIARDAARAQERAQKAQSAPQVASEGIERLKADFDRAVAYSAEKGLKLSPRITVDGITISPAKAHSKNPGALYVKAGTEYLGKVANGRFFAARECSAEQEARVVAFMRNPAEAAKVYGQTTGVCCVCNATLRSEWKNRGIGPICAEKFGW